jgi:hypothetical protein
MDPAIGARFDTEATSFTAFQINGDDPRLLVSGQGIELASIDAWMLLATKTESWSEKPFAIFLSNPNSRTGFAELPIVSQGTGQHT